MAAKYDGIHQYKGNVSNPLPATLTPTGTTQTVDWNNGNHQKIDLGSATGTVTLTLSNPQAGAVYRLLVLQSTGTARDLIWPGTVYWPGGTEPVISTGSGDLDLITLFYDGSNYFATFAQDFAA